MAGMSFALLQQQLDRAVSGASGYVLSLVDKLKANADAAPASEPDPGCDAKDAADNGCAALPAELLQHIFNFLDIDTLVITIPLVCKPWKAEVERYGMETRASRKLLDQRTDLAALGSPVSATHLYLALRGRNFLRNPAFRRECNTQLLELGRQTWNRWKRDAWVVSHTSKDGLSWEQPPAGFVSSGGRGRDPPPPPVPYGGGGVRLGERVQQQLKGLLSGLTAAAAAARGATEPAAQPEPEQQQQQQQGEEQRAAAHEQSPTSCIATSADWCEVMQVVDLDWELQRRGLSAAQAAALLDAELSLRLSVHVGARSDFRGQFSVGLLLDEGDPSGAVPQMQSFVMRPGRYSFFSGRVRCEGQDGWLRFEHRVTACPRGFRRALVLLRGRCAGAPPPPPAAAEDAAGERPAVEPAEAESGAGVAGARAAPPVFCGAKFACAELVFE
ncbi:hypothetical protein PLESTB_001464300 [Pleodorina starrii]|uniref:F-box domain-containing protein n=1 Tax=Pleodorina starrii TaxID=330485 RepID=A0A9W6BVY1_9CHLO|nr:hypothetical protein PLESTM_001682400 [Pleodorina starrii]GLC59229.1 hypothetical protein PLESTB_001464300 [Pleodorina starrii]GLC74793.1 hypothetical protein PLESTF_001556800 [Pleodorina starrii]